MHVGFRGAGADGTCGLRRRLRRHRRHRGSAHRRAVRARQRRLPLDPGEGARRPHRGGLRRAHAPARPHGVLGLRPRREPVLAGADPRDLPGHPPRPGLSGPARSHREGRVVRTPARRALDRRDADGELRHVAGLVGLGPLSGASGGALFRRRQGGARSGRGLRPS